MRRALFTAALTLAAMAPACYCDPLISDVYAQGKTDCTAPEHRQFDFWLGDWTVTAGGKVAGTNKIEAVMQGCGLLERWTSAKGGHGTSLNFYDRRTKTWSQAWIDEGGNALHLAGTFADGKMVLASEPRKTDAGVDVQRITWTKGGDGGVRQLWESSTDGGTTWTVAFDGVYSRKTAGS
jgi:hypothetical protein